MDLGLNGKTALVSASTAGIGFAIAKSLASEGASVWVNGRTEQRVECAVKELGIRVQGVAADLSTAEGCAKLFAAVPEVDIVVNNLGIYRIKPFFEITDEDWLRAFNENVLSGVRVSRHYLSAMLKRKWGRLLFITSNSGIQIGEEAVHYGVTKAAQFALARGIAEAVPESGVTVNSLIPGPTESELINSLIVKHAEQLNVTIEDFKRSFMTGSGNTNLLRRFAKTEEVASMATYLCSELASVTTGAPIRADGGALRSAF